MTLSYLDKNIDTQIKSDVQITINNIYKNIREDGYLLNIV